MANRANIPRPTVKRLSLYLRELEARADHDRQTISSKQLGEALGLTDAQVRKDLAYFGQFGHPGIGYRIPELIGQLRGRLPIGTAEGAHGTEHDEQRTRRSGRTPHQRSSRPAASVSTISWASSFSWPRSSRRSCGW